MGIRWVSVSKATTRTGSPEEVETKHPGTMAGVLGVGGAAGYSAAEKVCLV
jgi:hypothetical protein